MAENKTENGEVSVAEFFRSVFGKMGKWIFLGVTVLVTALAFVLLQFVLVSDGAYSYSYSIEFPGVEDERYPDGTRFNYFDSISKQNLTKIKASNGAFSAVDVDGMVKEEDITILRTVEKLTTGTEVSYKLSVSDKYFKDSDVADAFLRAVAATPIDYVTSSIQNLQVSSYLNNYYQEDSFYSRIMALYNQSMLLTNLYNQLINSTSGEILVSVGEGDSMAAQPLLQFAADLSYVFNDSIRSELMLEAGENGYIVDGDAEIAARKFEIWTNSLADIELEMGWLENQSSEAAGNRYAALAQQRTGKLQALSTLSAWTVDVLGIKTFNTAKTADVEACAAFSAKLDGYRAALAEQTEYYKEIYSKVTNVDSQIVFDSVKAEFEGGANLILNLAGSVVGGVVIGFVATWICSKVRKPKAPAAQ